MFFPRLKMTINGLIADADQIPTVRRQELEPLRVYIQQRVNQVLPVKLVFICTHNSRRSHLAQIWAQTAAAYYGVAGVQTFSGGTEATAFNLRAVRALVRVGFEIRPLTVGENPEYEVKFSELGPSIEAFSKVYDQAPNPQSAFCAVMTCTQADESCPGVSGADARVALAYEDPKAGDDSPDEAEIYEMRSRQIGREMFYLFSQINLNKTKGKA